jgi:hypothetical protein
MTNTVLKLYTAVIALLCAGAIAWSIDQSAAAGTWQHEVASWRAVAARSLANERAVAHRYRHLAQRYNRLVRDTRRSQRRLLASVNQTRLAAPPTVTPTAQVSTGPVAAPAPVASAPVTRTS